LINPFDDYLAKEYFPDKKQSAVNLVDNYVSAEKLFLPKIELSYSKARECAIASVNGKSVILHDVNDFHFFSSLNSKKEDIFYLCRGIMAERMLSLVLDDLLDELSLSALEKGIKSSYGILKENPRHAGKGFVLRSSENHILRHKNSINLVVMTKDNSALSDEAIYMQEKHGFCSTEIDGMGYLHFGKKKYLVVGETTTRVEFGLSSWKDSQYRTTPVEKRVFNPLKLLFPDHEIVYVVMARESLLWDRKVDPPYLKNLPSRVYSRLDRIDTGSIFIPLPNTNPSLDEIARELSEKIPFTKKILERYADNYRFDKSIYNSSK
jgi:hypothetical protein